MTHIRKIHNKRGVNSSVFNIPQDFCKSLNLSNGDYIKVTLVGDSIVLKKANMSEEESNTNVK